MSDIQHRKPALNGHRRDIFVLTYAIFAAGLCSIVYELLIATTVSYFEGDSVTYFSLTIGLYMAAMGLGAFASKAIKTDLVAWFVVIEILLSAVGGGSVAILYLVFTEPEFFIGTYIILTLLVGLLIGFEIPLLTRILDEYENLRVNIAHVLSLDYVGALIASVAFPLVILPLLGAFSGAVLIGLANTTIAFAVAWRFRDQLKAWRGMFLRATGAVTAALLALLFFSNTLMDLWSSQVYDGQVLHSEQSKYQKIVLTRFRGDLRLYLDGNLQFSSVDEHRYHEALAHIPLQITEKPRNVLVLGGGDGLLVRELLKHAELNTILIADLDSSVANLARSHPALTEINKNSLTRDPRVTVLAVDAFKVLRSRDQLFDVIIADLPDPNNPSLARLYTRDFYQLVRQNLAPSGIFVTQATSPYYSNRAFRAIQATVASVFAQSRPYHVWVPSFGDWGFVLASGIPIKNPDRIVLPDQIETRFLTTETISPLFSLPKDQDESGPVDVSTMDRPVILKYYLAGWRRWLD